MDRSSKQRINKDIVALNNTVEQVGLIDMYRNFYPKEQNVHAFQMHMRHFQTQTTQHDRTQNKPQQIQEN